MIRFWSELVEGHDSQMVMSCIFFPSDSELHISMKSDLTDMFILSVLLRLTMIAPMTAISHKFLVPWISTIKIVTAQLTRTLQSL